MKELLLWEKYKIRHNPLKGFFGYSIWYYNKSNRIKSFRKDLSK